MIPRLFGAPILAILFASSVDAVGSAHIINRCPYDVHINCVPASQGGHAPQKHVLSANDHWSQPWTRLKNDKGWSIKLSKSEHPVPENVLQYEYTFHNKGVIWYDMSYINGNPWGEDWQINASGARCNPEKKVYRYSTDDQHGMQAACPQDTAITVTLCASNLAPKDKPKPGRRDRRPNRGR